LTLTSKDELETPTLVNNIPVKLPLILLLFKSKLIAVEFEKAAFQFGGMLPLTKL